VANPGSDPDGSFVHAKVRLSFEELSGPMVVQMMIRETEQGPRIRTLSAVKGIHTHETVF